MPDRALSDLYGGGFYSWYFNHDRVLLGSLKVLTAAFPGFLDF